MFKFFKWFLVFTLGISLLVGCSSKDGKVTTNKLQVVTSFYPLYELSARIGGEYVDVTSLIPTGVEPHDWTPKSKDMMAITNADIFVMNGLGFESWADDFLNDQSNRELLVVEASKGINLIEAAHGDDEHDHAQEAFDPHVWTSPIQAIEMANNIYRAFVKKDSANQSTYKSNLNDVINELNQIRDEYATIVSQASRKEIVVSHEAFGYLARDFSIKQTAIMGLSPEAEPTAKDLKHISDFVKQNNVRYILVEELSSPKLAETLANDLGVMTLTFNPLEGLTEQQQKAGETYLSLMRGNARVLEKALQ